MCSSLLALLYIYTIYQYHMYTDSWYCFLCAQFDVNTYARAWQVVGPLHYPGSTECQLAVFGGNVHWDGFVGKRRNIGDIRIAFFGQLHNV